MSDGPLVLLEKEVETLKKELENKLKTHGKIEFKSSKTFDRQKYREDVDISQKELEDFNSKLKELETRLDEIKKEDEPNLKLNDKQFNYRKNQTSKKIKEYSKKIDKQKEKFKKDMEKLEKDEQKKNLKNASSKENLNKKEEAKVESVEEKPKETESKDQKTEIKDKDADDDDQEEEEDDDEEEEEDEEEDEVLEKEPKGLKTLMLEQKKKKDKQKEIEEIEDIEDIEQGQKSTKTNEVLTDSASKLKSKQPQKQPQEAPKIIISRPNSSKQDQKQKDASNEINPETPALNSLMASLQKTKQKPIEDDVATSDLGETAKSDDKLIKNYTNQMNDDDEVSVEEVSDEEETELSQNNDVKNNKAKMDKKELEEDEDDDDEGEEDLSQESGNLEEEEEEENAENLKPGTQYIATEDYEAEQEGDLTFKRKDILTLISVSDENWFTMKDKNGNEGQAPRDYLKFHAKTAEQDPNESLTTSRSQELWKNIKDSSKLKKLVDPKELKAAGLVPESFSLSKLSLLSKEDQYSYVKYLTPKLSESNLIFKNLFYDSNEQGSRSRSVSFQKLIMINKCTNIPVPNKDELEILNRYVRICLFDKTTVLSNIYTISAHTNGKDENTWIFENHINELSNVAKCSELFIRFNLPMGEHANPNMGILFELSMHCIKKKTNEETHLSCGWTHLLFKDSQNNVIANRNYDLVLNGGSIFDKPGQSVNPNISRTKTNKTLFGNLIDNVFRESKIKFNVNNPNNQMTKTLNCLVEPLIGSTLMAPFIKYYFDELVLTVLKPLVETDTQEFDATPMHSAFLATFPKALSHSDLINYVKKIFDEKRSAMKRDERNDENKLRKKFIDLFLRIAYPLLHMSDFYVEQFDSESIKAREETMERHFQAVHKNDVLKSLLSEDEDHEAFDLNELSYQFLNEYSYN